MQKCPRHDANTPQTQGQNALPGHNAEKLLKKNPKLLRHNIKNTPDNRAKIPRHETKMSQTQNQNTTDTRPKRPRHKAKIPQTQV